MKRTEGGYGLWLNQAFDDVAAILANEIDGEFNTIEGVWFENLDGHRIRATTAGEIARLRKVPDVKEVLDNE